jgi:hypothetical protein
LTPRLRSQLDRLTQLDNASEPPGENRGTTVRAQSRQSGGSSAS